ncbi:MAG: acyltransferase [Planctomycetaceae bacterium]|nr:acyltransferase [Planctomycetaceae bacterium]
MKLRKLIFLKIAAIRRHAKSMLCTIWAKLLFWFMDAQYGRQLKVSGWIHVKGYGKITIGSNVRINSGSEVNSVGGDRRTHLVVGPEGRLKIEAGVGMSNSTIIAMESVEILENTLIGGGCDIYDFDFHEIDADDRATKRGNIGISAVRIGPAAFIGAYSIVLKGVSIGEGAVVGAGSLVTRDIPSFELWAGRPAKFIRKIRDN